MPTLNATRKSAQADLRRSARALDAARRRRSSPLAMCRVLADLARACRGLHDLASTESYLDEALRWARVSGSSDLAACERMRDHAFEAATLAHRVADGHWEAKVLMRVGEVLERCGDRDDAVLLQTRALRLMSGSLSGAAPDPAWLPSLGRLADI